MGKLLELEKKLKEYREELEKMSTPINTDGEEINKDEDQENSMEACKMEEIKFQKNGQWHLEDLEKGLGKDLEAGEHREKIKHALGSIRPSATVTDTQGKVTEVSAAKQVSDKASASAQKKANAKAQAESEAAVRRAGYKKQGLMKNNAQWELE